MTDANCVFCKIIAGEIPSLKVYEDDVVFAFLDIQPVVKGHTLIVPKEHHVNILDIPPELLGAVGKRLPKVAKAVLRATGATACHVLFNNGEDANQSVRHLHYHLMPRQPNDGYELAWKVSPLDKEIGRALAKQIAEFIKEN